MNSKYSSAEIKAMAKHAIDRKENHPFDSRVVIMIALLHGYTGTSEKETWDKIKDLADG